MSLRAHLRVVDDGGAGEAGVLDEAGAGDAGADGGGGFAGAGGEEFLLAQAGDFDVDVQPVEDGAADARLVFRHGVLRAGAGARHVAQVAARAGVHGGDQLQAGGVG